MYHKTQVYFLLIILLSFSCRETPRNQGKSEMIYIDQLERIGNTDFLPESFVKETRYINLYSADIELNFKDISKVQMYGNYLFIMDLQTSKLLVYDLAGNGICQVGNRGNGPNEYLSITDFDIDKSGNIYVLDGNLDRLFIYDKMFKYLSAKKMPCETDIIKVLDNGGFLLGLSSWNEGKYRGAKVVRTDNELENIEVLSMYDEYVDNSVWISGYTFISNEEGILYSRPAENEILQFSNTGELQQTFQFNFGGDEMPGDKKKDIKKHFHSLEDYIILKCFTAIEKNYMFGTFLLHGKTKSFFIDRKENILYTGKELPVAVTGEIAGYHDKTIISYIIPDMDEKESASLPLETKEHLANGDFVICLHSLK